MQDKKTWVEAKAHRGTKTNPSISYCLWYRSKAAEAVLMPRNQKMAGM